MGSNVVDIQPRPSPRITVTKLAEYLTAQAGRRKKIIKDQKYPPMFQMIRYTEAERAIVDFLTGRREVAVLEAARTRLADGTPKSEFDAERRQLCIEAIGAFEDVVDGLELDGLSLTAASSSAPHLAFAGVDISVRPEATISRRGRSALHVGCLKLYFSKSCPLDDRAGAYASTMLAEFGRANLSGKLDEELLMTIDVFSRRVFHAPRARSRRIEDVVAACEEIAIRWEAA